MKQILYFSADWCQHCPQMAKSLDQIKNQIQVNKINIDYDQSTVEKFSVGSVPTIILVEGDNELKRYTGAMSPNQIIDWLNN